MYKAIIEASGLDLPITVVIMYLYPTIYDDLEKVIANINYDPRQDTYVTDINPARTINGPFPDTVKSLKILLKMNMNLSQEIVNGL